MNVAGKHTTAAAGPRASSSPTTAGVRSTPLHRLRTRAGLQENELRAPQAEIAGAISRSLPTRQAQGRGPFPPKEQICDSPPIAHLRDPLGFAKISPPLAFRVQAEAL